jgi:hypothetical protein
MFRETVAKMPIQNYREIFAFAMTVCPKTIILVKLVFELENWKSNITVRLSRNV